MWMRETYLESRTVLPNSGERTTDIRLTDPISAIAIEVRCTNGSTDNKANLLAACISSIEVIDGSDVLYSLDGYEAEAFTAYFLKAMQFSIWSEAGSTVQSLLAIIPFGRFLGDQQYALDPLRFTNLQVRINWNIAAVRAVAVTAFATGTCTLTVVPYVMMGARKPIGLITAKEIYSWVTVSGSTEYIDLPTDNTYLGIMYRATKAATAPITVINNVKIHANQEAITLFNLRGSDLVRQMSLNYPEFQYRHLFSQVDAGTIYNVLKQSEVPVFTVISPEDTVLTYNNYGYGEGVVEVNSAGSANSSACSFMAYTHGRCPHACIWVPFGDYSDPDQWLPADTFRSLRAEMGSGSSSGSGYIVAVQSRLYK